ncbi:hypothetical protein LEMLEM_LOCUS16468 [Lemmus lemmus]
MWISTSIREAMDGELMTPSWLISGQVSDDLTEQEFTEAMEVKEVAQQEAKRAGFVAEKG